jgi:hypothetical protein
MWKEPSSPNLICFPAFHLEESRHCHYKNQTIRGWNAGRGKTLFSSPNHPDRPCGPPSLPFNVYRVSFPRGKAAGAWSSIKYRGYEWEEIHRCSPTSFHSMERDILGSLRADNWALDPENDPDVPRLTRRPQQCLNYIWGYFNNRTAINRMWFSLVHNFRPGKYTEIRTEAHRSAFAYDGTLSWS